MIGYEEALALLLRDAAPLDAESLAAFDGAGRVLAADVHSPAPLPRFDNAAMDGFALALGDATGEAGTEWPVLGSTAAGDAAARPDGTARQGAWEIMTGAVMPDGLDSVVPVERVDALGGDEGAPPARIRLREPVRAGANVRRRGEDIAEGARVLAKSERLDPARIMLLAALGIERVPLVRRPRVALIATGRELAEGGEAGEGAWIHDSNTPFLRLRLHAAGAEMVACERVGDDPAGFAAALDRVLAHQPDLVISTGAVSRGRFDFVPDSLRARGAELRFHGVAIRPGKPLLCARLREGPLHVGLPGNPASCAVGLRFFVEPLLRAMLGLPRERPTRLPLAAPVHARANLRTHLHAMLESDGEGRLAVHPLPRQESFRLAPFLSSQAWLVLPETGDGSTVMEPGQVVDVYPPGHLEPLAWRQGHP
ncbi:gephyrin-like molybdotransferase Glp [Pseudoxanthomonas sp. z9]|uniref:molybdopterin molybdotransferase MoeA n=1 Tax=Pseudoxanthomonas sp. z9 TaxID=2584942 RepID=UPI0015E8991F|nr:gephyrin-like molybdotransferase Glp [Pseudoxanthomonas sp. z9]